MEEKKREHICFIVFFPFLMTEFYQKFIFCFPILGFYPSQTLEQN